MTTPKLRGWIQEDSDRFFKAIADKILPRFGLEPDPDKVEPKLEKEPVKMVLNEIDLEEEQPKKKIRRGSSEYTAEEEYTEEEEWEWGTDEEENYVTKKDHEELERKYVQLKQKHNQVKQENSGLRRQLEEANKKNLGLGKDLRERDQKILELEKELAEKKKEILEMKPSPLEAKKALFPLENSSDVILNKAGILANALSSMDEALENIEKEKGDSSSRKRIKSVYIPTTESGAGETRSRRYTTSDMSDKKLYEELDELENWKYSEKPILPQNQEMQKKNDIRWLEEKIVNAKHMMPENKQSDPTDKKDEPVVIREHFLNQKTLKLEAEKPKVRRRLIEERIARPIAELGSVDESSEENERKISNKGSGDKKSKISEETESDTSEEKGGNINKQKNWSEQLPKKKLSENLRRSLQDLKNDSPENNKSLKKVKSVGNFKEFVSSGKNTIDKNFKEK